MRQIFTLSGCMNEKGNIHGFFVNKTQCTYSLVACMGVGSIHGLLPVRGGFFACGVRGECILAFKKEKIFFQL
jgi:hypothetical protein